MLSNRNFDFGPFSHLRCKYLREEELTVEQKHWLGSQIHQNIVKATTLQKIFDLPLTSLRWYAYKVAHGKCFKKKQGRPRRLDDEAELAIIQDIVQKRKESDCIRSQQLKGIIVENIRNTQIRQGKAALVNEVSTSTINRYKKGLNLAVVQAQTITDARLTAEHDVRNFFAEAVMQCCPPDVIMSKV